MGAPDNITISRDMDGVIRHQYWTTDQNLSPFDDTEYIRKDALVDWLKRKQDTTLKVVEDDLIQEVIDHINEM